MKFYLAALLIVCTSPTYADYLELINNSAFQLNAVIQDARGVTIGTLSIPPGTTTNWANWNQSSDYSQTPYTVSWLCPAGAVYSTCVGVAEGATVPASGCDGTHSCPPKQKQPQAPEEAGSVQSAY